MTAATGGQGAKRRPRRAPDGDRAAFRTKRLPLSRPLPLNDDGGREVVDAAGREKMRDREGRGKCLNVCRSDETAASIIYFFLADHGIPGNLSSDVEFGLVLSTSRV